MARVYLETSFVSACVTTRTDAASVYRRDTSREWWETQGPRHDRFVSALVLDELGDPRFPQRDAAIRWVESVPVLGADPLVAGLATAFVRERVMPAPETGDALHVAFACIHRIEYLLSWNVRHLANPNKLVHLRAVCARLGVVPPLIVTPDLLWETDP